SRPRQSQQASYRGAWAWASPRPKPREIHRRKSSPAVFERQMPCSPTSNDIAPGSAPGSSTKSIGAWTLLGPAKRTALTSLFFEGLHPALGLPLTPALFVEPFHKLLGHPKRDEPADVSAQPADLLDESRRDELVALGSHQKYSIDLGIETGVHARHLELVLEIRDCSQAAQNHRGADALGKMHQQGIE